MERPSADSEEIADSVVVDYDADGQVVGIEIDPASKKVDMKRLQLAGLPGKVETVAA